MNSTPDLDLAAIKARDEAATPGPWRWQGNIDTGEPYLASRAPGMGASVLAIGTEDRSTTGRAADDVREYASDSGLDPDAEVEQWATDQYGEPIQEPRLWFYTDHMAVDARKRVTFEVAPNAKHRDDPKVYRADITGIRHPDAEFIASARSDVSALIAEVERLRERLALSEDVACLVGWTASRSVQGTTRDKALEELWMQWANHPDVSTRPQDWPHLSDEHLESLAARRDEILADTLARIARGGGA